MHANLFHLYRFPACFEWQLQVIGVLVAIIDIDLLKASSILHAGGPCTRTKSRPRADCIVIQLASCVKSVSFYKKSNVQGPKQYIYI